MTNMVGCEACAELTTNVDYCVEDTERQCPSCEGTLLTMQEAFDKILQLKRQLEDLGYEEETIG